VYRTCKAVDAVPAWSALLETVSSSYHCGSNPFQCNPSLMMNPKEVTSGCASLLSNAYFTHAASGKFPDACVSYGTGAFLLERQRKVLLTKFATVRPLCRVCLAADVRWAKKKPKKQSAAAAAAAADAAAAQSDEFSCAATPKFLLMTRDRRRRPRSGVVVDAAAGKDSTVACVKTRHRAHGVKQDWKVSWTTNLTTSCACTVAT